MSVLQRLTDFGSLKATVKRSKYSYKDFARHIALFLGVEFTEEFYQRQYQLHFGDSGTTANMTPEEEEAVAWWLDTYKNPFEKSAIAFKFRNIDKNLQKIQTWSASPADHRKNIHNMIRKLRSSIS